MFPCRFRGGRRGIGGRGHGVDRGGGHPDICGGGRPGDRHQRLHQGEAVQGSSEQDRQGAQDQHHQEREHH